MVTTKGGLRLDEVPELEPIAEHLENLSVRDVMIRPVQFGDHTAWQAVVMLNHVGGRGGYIPWILGLRPSEADARAAVTAFLQGVAAARESTIAGYPSPSTEANTEKENRRRVIEAAINEWYDRAAAQWTALGRRPNPRSAR